MILICTFVIGYLDVDGYPARHVQPAASCAECAELVSAYIEAGPPHWLMHQTVVPMCVRREEEAEPA